MGNSENNKLGLLMDHDEVEGETMQEQSARSEPSGLTGNSGNRDRLLSKDAQGVLEGFEEASAGSRGFGLVPSGPFVQFAGWRRCGLAASGLLESFPRAGEYLVGLQESGVPGA